MKNINQHKKGQIWLAFHNSIDNRNNIIEFNRVWQTVRSISDTASVITRTSLYGNPDETQS